MKRIMIFSIGIIITNLAYAKIDPADLVKVDNNTKAKCVEYVSYKNELYCTTKPTANAPNDIAAIKSDPQHIQFDDRIWKAAWGKKTDKITVVEYIPDGDDINNWNELVTSQTSYGLEGVSVKEAAKLFLNRLSEQGFQYKATTHETTAKREIFEFQIKEPESQRQDVIVSITSGNNALYILQYAVKKYDMGAAVRKRWIENFQKSTHGDGDRH